MSKLGFTKRVLAGLLSFAMVFQGMALNVAADEINNDVDIETTVGATEEVPEQLHLDGEDAAEEDPALEIGDLKAGYTAITVPITNLGGVSSYYIYYGKKGEALNRRLSSKVTSTGNKIVEELLPNTEYDIAFFTAESYPHKLVKKMTAKTLAYDVAKANLTITKPDNGALHATYKYDATGLDYSESVYVNFAVSDASGNVFETVAFSKSLNSGMNTYTYDITQLPGGQEFTVTASFSTDDAIGSAKYCELSTKETPTSGTAFSATANLIQSTGVIDNITLTLDAPLGGSSTEAYVWYKAKDAKLYNFAGAIVSSVDTDITFECDSLEYGKEHEFIFVIDGYKVAKMFNPKNDSIVSNVTVYNEYGSSSYESDIRYNPTSEEIANNNSYEINVYYDDADFPMISQTMTSSGSGEDKYYSYKFIEYGLYPGKEYKFKYVIKSSNGSYIYTKYETITTLPENTTVAIDSYVSSFDYDVRIPSGFMMYDDVSRDYLEDSKYELYVYDESENCVAYDWFYTDYLSEEDNLFWHYQYSLGGLKSDTSYKYILVRDAETIKEGTFKTLKDMRKITLDKIGMLYKGAYIKGSVNEHEPEMTFAYHKVGETEWHTSEVYVDEYSFYDEFDFSEYKSGDVIEYRLGFTSDEIESMPGMLTGTCKVIEDIRTLQKASEISALDGTIVNVKVNGPYNYDSYIYGYYREKGTESWSSGVSRNIEFDSEYEEQYVSYYGYMESDVFPFTIKVSSPVEGKTYEYIIGYKGEASTPDKLIKTIKGEFTIGKDERDITAHAVKETVLDGLYVYGDISGAGPIDGTNVVMYYKEKGSDGSDSKVSVNVKAGETEFKKSITGYKPGTTYEYTIGIGDTDSTLKEKLKAVKTGEFTTKGVVVPEIKNVVVTPGYTRVHVKADLVNLPTTSSSVYIYLFYREKGTSAWSSSSKYVSKISKADSCTFDDDFNASLAQNTEYEYVLSLKSTYPESDATPEGTFKTKSQDSAGLGVSFKQIPDATTQHSASMEVTVTGTTDQKVRLNITYIDPADKDNELHYNNFVISKQKNYVNTIVFDNLKDNTTYTITKVALSGYDSASYYALTPDITPAGDINFSTKAYPSTSTGLSLSTEKLSLNSNKYYDSDEYETHWEEGVNYAYLHATLAGDNVNRNVEFISSDDNVVDAYNYDEDTADVYALNPGTATISANSVANKGLIKNCEVVVKNYAIGYMEDSVFHDVSAEYFKESKAFPIYKGNEIKNWQLFEWSDTETKYVAISGNAIAARENIIETKDGSTEFKALNVGTTAVYFMNKDTGVKAVAYVRVAAEPRQFAVTALYSTDSDYPAIEKAWEGNPKDSSILDKAIPTEYDIALVGGISYSIKGVVSPTDAMNLFAPANFTYSSSDESIAMINTSGMISPKKAGTVTITVQPKEDSKALYKDIKKEFKVNVKALPPMNNKTIFVETHTASKLKDVDLPALLGQKDWEWKLPETPLYSLPVNDSSYYFEIKYTGAVYYPVESTVEIYLSTINKLDIKDYSLQLDKLNDPKKSKSTLTADGKDSIYLNLEPSYYGNISGLLYDYVIEPIDGLTVTKEGQRYKVTANKKGKFKLVANVKIGEKNIAKGEYEIQAVTEPLVGAIELGSEDEIINAQLFEGIIYLDSNETKTFAISANAIGRDGTPLGTDLDWKTTDKAVVTVAVDKNDNHKATLTVKGNGHAVISVTAKDVAGYHKELNFQVRDHSPRFDDKNATVNTLFDYETIYGIDYAKSNCVNVEVAGVYADEINWDKTVVTKAGNAPSEFEIINVGLNEYRPLGADLFRCIIKPKKEYADIANGTYKYYISVKTKYRQEPYVYPITVKVINTPIKAKIKTSYVMNLFYLPDAGDMDVYFNYKDLVVSYEKPVWEDNDTAHTGNEFAFGMNSFYTDKNNTKVCYSIGQKNVAVNGTKLRDKGVDSGKLTVRILGTRNKTASGVSDRVTVDKVKVKTKYKKASILALNSGARNPKTLVPTGKTVTNLVPEIGQNFGYLYFYDKTTKDWLYNGVGEYVEYYNGAYSATPDIKVSTGAGYAFLRYLGNKKSEKTVLTFVSDNWRENVTAKHSIKCVKPVANLTKKTVTINKKFYSYLDDQVILKPDITGVSFADLVVAGVDNKAKGVIADDRLQVFKYNSDSLRIKINDLKVLGQDVPKGKYSYNVTPYVMKNDGTKMPLKAVKLTVNVIDKDLSVKVSPSGVLDLIDHGTKNRVKLKRKVAGNDNLKLVKAELVGEYSSYFDLMGYYDEKLNTFVNDYSRIAISGYGRERLKAKQKYKLRVKYTYRLDGDNNNSYLGEDTPGKEFTVTSNEFTVKTKQSTPKVKVGKINRNFFVATKDMNRETTISTKVPLGYGYSGYYYEHNEGDVLGSIDANKDGKPDAQVVYVGDNSFDGVTLTAKIDVQVLDANALLSSAKGTKHTIPMTIKFVGRDGIAKDSTAKVIINVKR